ncbi:MAG: magnesium/cobalt transporter CorA [Parvibaculaceae bacterium]|nr:magnesium/cobalt transporter CorA [Parvibaculaceae bacterium]
MITAYVRTNGSLSPISVDHSGSIPHEAVWIDLVAPSEQEVRLVDEELQIDIPSLEQMEEIEVSSRLYEEDNAIYLTSTVLTNADTDQPEGIPVTFVMVGHRLVTLRYGEPLPFKVYAAKARRHHLPCSTGEEVLSGLLDAIVDRVADVLERIQRDLDDLSRVIFAKDRARGKVDFEAVLRGVGRIQALTSKARDCLVGINRVLSFLGRPSESRVAKASSKNFKTIARDVTALSDHATFLTSNINFVLDATLGMINSEQNGIIKIFSVAAVVFLPPTLLASIYGMNFQVIPELKWEYGYPFAIGMMILSAVLPYYFFKRRGWL